MVFFKRLSRSSRSNSYVDDTYDDAPDPHSPSANANAPPSTFDRYDSHQRPTSQRLSLSQHNIHSSNPNFQTGQLDKDIAVTSPPGSAGNMYRSSQRSGSGAHMANGNGVVMSHSAMPIDGPVPTSANSLKFEPAPDLLTRAFNEAVRPYSERIEALEAELADLRSYLENMESERREVFQWIDKRGLRPDVPPAIASAMDAHQDPSVPPTAAATTLSAQLDRKITIVNFDLHRLQDDLNDSISTAHFAASMLKFLPEISRLSSLPSGPKHAFDLVLKLGGNLNSHGGLDSTSPDDVDARKDFFDKLDNALVAVVERRFDEEGQDWGVQREIRRLEKTREYLRQFGVEPYFPRSLDLMKNEAGVAAAQGGYASDGGHSGSQGVNGVNGSGSYVQGVPQNGGSPPKY